LSLQSLVHLGSYNRDRCSIQRLVRAVTETHISTMDASLTGLPGKDVFCWHYSYWESIPPDQRSDHRVACFFYHHLLHGFDDPCVVAGICMNHRVYEALRRRQPHKPVYIARVGGAEDAVPHARRRLETAKIRLLVVGNPLAPLPVGPGDDRQPVSRKGPELIVPVGERLDRRRYAWVFIGPNWAPFAEELARSGWTVICPDELPDPEHFVYYGEGDVFLMLSRLEGGPLPLLEAMGLGIWPICTDTGLAPEIITHGVNGHILPSYTGNNLHEVADAAAASIRSLDRRALLKSEAVVRESVADWTWPNFKHEIDAFLRNTFMRA
jgi:glycosyltransferase involved in cell wall biosynthesis